MKNIVSRFRLWWTKFLVRAPFVDDIVVHPVRVQHQNRRALLARRPHRSFRRTRRRDYVRGLAIPGYWAFSAEVIGHLRRYKGTFIRLAVLYALLSAVLVGLASQDVFNQLRESLSGADVFNGGFGQISQAGLLFTATMMGSLNAPSANGTQGSIGLILVLIVWLTTVWLIRAQLGGGSPRMRDGLYQAGSPIIALFMVTLYAVVQLIPAAIGAILAGGLAAFSDSLGAIGALGWLVVILLFTLSLYWLTSTFIAAVVVTLPGMYPWQAIRISGDLVIGRRLRILLRVLWAFLQLAAVWLVVMIPVLLLVIWLGSMWSWIAAAPIIPVLLLLLTTASVIWLSAYIYMLYRKVVDDGSAPA